MKRVGIQEFGEQANELLTGDEPLTVEQQGRVVGVYIPLISEPVSNGRDPMQALRQAAAAALANHATSEDELAELFDLRHPLP